ncbi:MAG: hypothetical protein Q7R70_03555 [Candidatus Diapherotrites archaeon]|nr:hypothetical protein [Candidatus Diapherotrites archaeon]
MKLAKIAIAGIIIIMLIFLSQFILGNWLNKLASTPCGYNYGLLDLGPSPTKKTCDCSGVTVDTSNSSLLSMGARPTTGCIGSASNFKCYYDLSYQVPMLKNQGTDNHFWIEQPCVGTYDSQLRLQNISLEVCNSLKDDYSKQTCLDELDRLNKRIGK